MAPPPPPSSSSSSSCPFCLIASALPPSHAPRDLHSPSGAAYVLLSTPSAVAILDIAPVARGHALLMPRRHAATLGELSVAESAALGVWLPVVSRGVVGAVGGGGEGEGEEEGEAGEAAWNVVQANGASAGQTIPHIHFHIIPRDSNGQAVGESTMTDAERKNLVLGEGPRVRISKEEGEEISGLVRDEISREVKDLMERGELAMGEEDGEIWAMMEEGRLML